MKGVKFAGFHSICDAIKILKTAIFKTQLYKIQYGGDSVKTSSVDLSGFIPVDPKSRFDHADEKKRSPGYMTYEGSMTQPGIWYIQS